MTPPRDDEWMNVPTWRMRQLQDIEHAAREAVELLAVPLAMVDLDLIGEVKALLGDALESHGGDSARTGAVRP